MTEPATSPPGLAAAAALAHASRRRIANLLANAPSGLGVAAIADGVGLHPNAVRQHLDVLARAGVIAAERRPPHGRGRPGFLYRLVDPEAPRIAAHQELVRMLVNLLRRTGIGPDEIEAYGREQGARLVTGAGVHAFLDGFARMGFAPRELGTAADRRKGRLELSLEHCPFRDAVAQPGGDLICTLHRGLSAGMASRAAASARLTEFQPRDPFEAGCRLVVEDLVVDSGGEAGAA
jgi:predicted ArsR family transcriptional regulator